MGRTHEPRVRNCYSLRHIGYYPNNLPFPILIWCHTATSTRVRPSIFDRIGSVIIVRTICRLPTRAHGLSSILAIHGNTIVHHCRALRDFMLDLYQRCVVHFYRNVFSVVPRTKVRNVALMLKAIHAQENKEAARKKAEAVAEELRSMKLKEAAKKVCDSVEETLTYMDFPSEHWQKIRTNNVIERLNREIRRRTRVVGTFSDGNSALMLVCARLRHVAGTQWGGKKYMNMKHLEMQEDMAG